MLSRVLFHSSSALSSPFSVLKMFLLTGLFLGIGQMFSANAQTGAEGFKVSLLNLKNTHGLMAESPRFLKNMTMLLEQIQCTSVEVTMDEKPLHSDIGAITAICPWPLVIDVESCGEFRVNNRKMKFTDNTPGLVDGLVRYVFPKDYTMTTHVLVSEYDSFPLKIKDGVAINFEEALLLDEDENGHNSTASLHENMINAVQSYDAIALEIKKVLNENYGCELGEDDFAWSEKEHREHLNYSSFRCQKGRVDLSFYESTSFLKVMLDGGLKTDLYLYHENTHFFKVANAGFKRVKIK